MTVLIVMPPFEEEGIYCFCWMSVGLSVDQIVFDQLLGNRLTDCSDFFCPIGKSTGPIGKNES